MSEYLSEYEEEIERQFGEDNNEFPEDNPVTEQDQRDKAPMEYDDCYEFDEDMDIENPCMNCYNVEIGITRYRKNDFKGALEAFQCPNAMVFLGTMFENGIGTERSYEKAFGYYNTRNKSKGYSEFRIGMMYLSGKGVEKSAEYGEMYLQKSYHKGSPDAALALATMYEMGTYVLKDNRMSKECYKKAFERLMPLAENGRSYAERQIGLMYEKGKGVEQSDTLAKKWYELSCSHKETWEQECLSRCLDACDIGEGSAPGIELNRCNLLTDLF